MHLLFVILSCLLNKQNTIQAHSQITVAQMFFVCKDKSIESCGIETSLIKGSATRIKWKNHYYWLTAGHVCAAQNNTKRKGGGLAVETALIADIAETGEKEYLTKVVYEETYDLCLLDAKQGKIREIAKKQPKNGEKVHAFAYPGGVYDKNMYPLYEGTWNGMIENRCNVSVPVIGGSSGAAILNQDEEIVSVVSATMIDFNHITLTVCLKDVLNFIEKADVLMGNEQQ